MTQPVPPLPPLASLWNFGDPAGTEAKFRALLDPARASGDGAYLCELLTQIARTEGLQQRFDDAHRTLDEAEALLRPEWARARVYCLLERGRTLRSGKRAPEAAPVFLRAWDEARAAGLDGLAVDAAHMTAMVGTEEQSFAWNGKAIALAEGSADPVAQGWLGSLYNNSAWDFHKAGRFAEALPLFEKALRFREERKQAGGIRVQKWCVARCLRSLGRLDEALAAQEALRAACEAAGQPDGFVFEEIGECLLALGRIEEARPRFGEAHALLSQDVWLARDEPERLKRLARIAGGGAA